MKRTAAAFVLLAGLGGCMTTDKKATTGMPGKGYPAPEVTAVVGPHGEPVTPAAYRGSTPDGVTRADLRGMGPGGVQTASGYGMGHIGHKANGGYVPTGPDGTPGYYPGRGILPVPSQPPWGAVAAVGSIPQGGGPMAMLGGRTSVRISEPQGMRFTWYGPAGLVEPPYETPARYNFAQGGIYRLKLGSIQGRPGTELYPTLEVYPATAKTATYLAHSSVPLSFTDEDFEQVTAGNFLIKVVYLPDPQYQDLAAVAGPAEVISTRLEPGVDPIAEARRRGEILLVIRMGNIDLEAKGTPALDAPSPYAGGPRPPVPTGPSPMPGGPAPMKLP